MLTQMLDFIFLIVAIEIVAMFQLFSFVLLKYLYKSAFYIEPLDKYIGCSTSQVFMRTALRVFYSRQLMNLLYILYIYIITNPYQIPLFSLCNISAIAASTFYQEKIWYSSVIIIDNYFGQTALLNILQPASGFALSSFSFALSQLQYIQ